ncbi:hypothetical protein N0V83_009114 [Neocucurbitaria cava]|uniref:Uncharacterized protein n=1 Tax=Neocucurbitaria cava TaxID=798079 RepID=A0A9W8Y191_9PLEO|nr:hypothetical protein N0V83_009114 [Neocucurbitaria cava]
MLLPEKDQDAFKRWILPKLETISDADAEVLADYVIALVLVNDSEANIKRNCLESLSDFLRDDTKSFVEVVLRAIKNKSYARAGATATGTSTPQTAPIPSIVGTSNSEYEPHVLRPNTPPPGAPKGPATTRATSALHRLHDRPIGPSHSRDTQQSRKRKQVEHETSAAQEAHDPHYGHTGGERPLKQTARRGGRNALGEGRASQHVFPGLIAMPDLSNPSLPSPPPGDLPFDPANPMAFFMMMAAMNSGLPVMMPSSFPAPQGNAPNQQPQQLRCVDYYTKGICILGSFCPYEHVNAISMPADKVPEHNPEHASQVLSPNSGADGLTTHRGQGRSAIHPSHPRTHFTANDSLPDLSNTTLYVVGIPQDNFSEEDVRDFFSQFGTILEIRLQKYTRRAVIKFEDHDAAERACSSPKAVFDNRFVKVYWYLPPNPSPNTLDDGETTSAAEEEEEKIDFEEVAKRQAVAQKAFEERRAKEEEIAAMEEDIKKQLKEKVEGARKIKDHIRAVVGDRFERDFTPRLGNLQDAAEDLFTQFDGTEAFSGRGRGRGAFPGNWRGRGYAASPRRGRVFASFRGGSRGRSRGRGSRGHPLGNRVQSSVKRLDNRPRRIVVAAIEAESSRDEALRQYLLNVHDCASIERHPEQKDALILTFKERYQAEMFIDDSYDIPGVGVLDLAWVPNDAFGGIKSTEGSSNTTATGNGGRNGHFEAGSSGDDDDDDDDDDKSSTTIGEHDDNAGGTDTEDHTADMADADMDVADDIDQWL